MVRYVGMTYESDILKQIWEHPNRLWSSDNRDTPENKPDNGQDD